MLHGPRGRTTDVELPHARAVGGRAGRHDDRGADSPSGPLAGAEGVRRPRGDAVRILYAGVPLKVTGRAEYTDDIHRPGELIGRLLRSPWPHARLRSVDVTAA